MKTPLTFVMRETYSVWHDSDIDIGETDDRGSVYESEKYFADELKEYIKRNDFDTAGECPETNNDISLTACDRDFETGARTVKNLDCCKVLDADGIELNKEQAKKIWTALVRQSTAVNKHLSGYEI